MSDLGFPPRAGARGGPFESGRDESRRAELTPLAVDLGVVAPKLVNRRAVPSEDPAKTNEIPDMHQLRVLRIPCPAPLEAGGVGKNDCCHDRVSSFVEPALASPWRHAGQVLMGRSLSPPGQGIVKRG
jgi:hypothetical protein